MKNPEQRLCVSIAGSSIDELARKSRKARKSGADFTEFRVDYLQDLSAIEMISKLKSLFDGKEIVTVRKKTEGGRFRGSESRRVSLISRILKEARPQYIDIEIETLQQNPELLEDLKASRSKLIASHHSLTSSPRSSELAAILNQVPRIAFAAKLVFKANSFRDNLTILSLYDSAINSIAPVKLIAFCVGELGIYSRIECLLRGSPFSYVSLPEEAVAPGQLDITTMKSTLATRAL